MQINKTSNKSNLTFGIKYLNKAKWDKKVLKSFENSTLLKSIDNKYPSASIHYDKFYDFETNTHTLSAILKLCEDKMFRWSLSSHNENVPKKHFNDFINTTSLEEIENKSLTKLSLINPIKIRPIKPTIPQRIKNFINQLNK